MRFDVPNYPGAEIDLEAGRKLGDAPARFLAKNWVNPHGNYGALHGFALWTNLANTPADFKLPIGVNMLAPIGPADLYRVTGFNDPDGVAIPSPKAYCALMADTTVGSPIDYTTYYSLVREHLSFVPVYFLPSRGNQISSIHLDATPGDGRPRVMLTTPVDGCSIFVTCDNVMNPLDAANHVRVYHANGSGTGARPAALTYTRQLLQAFTNHSGQHLALELTTDDYYGQDVIDEQTRKANKGYTVNSATESGKKILVVGIMNSAGVWSFHYQVHVVIDYDRVGIKKKIYGESFDGEKSRLLPLHPPDAGAWGVLGGIP